MSVRILAIDTATEACSVALMLNDNFFLERFIVPNNKHIKYILPMIDSLLKEACIKLDSLDALAFCKGPGSFTGVRIGIGVAQGLALGANLPLISVSTLAVLAEGAWRKTGICKVLSAMDARMGEIYWAKYKRQGPGIWLVENNEIVITPDILTKINQNLKGCWATAGTGWKTYPMLLNKFGLQLVSGRTLLSSARDILPLAINYFKNGVTQTVSIVEPVYLHNKCVWKKLPGRN